MRALAQHVWFACLLTAAAPSTGLAQDSVATVSIGGIVRDTSGRLLTGAEVRSGERFTVTSDSGRFLLADLMPDTVELMVRRIGYRPVATAFVIRPGFNITVSVTMTPSGVTLGTIVVEGKRLDAHLWKAGFYERSKLGMGTFFTPEDLRHRGSTISGLLAEVPSVTIQRDQRNRAAAMGRFGNGQCLMNVFVDGTLVRWAPDVGLDAVLPKDEILAIEVYPRPALVPSVLVGLGGGGSAAPGQATMTSQGQRSDCGAIFLWTKPFEPGRKSPE